MEIAGDIVIVLIIIFIAITIIGCLRECRHAGKYDGR